jgi:hypothetical protein
MSVLENFQKKWPVSKKFFQIFFQSGLIGQFWGCDVIEFSIFRRAPLLDCACVMTHTTHRTAPATEAELLGR